MEWNPIRSAPEGVVVWTKIGEGANERNVQRLIRKGRLWFFPDCSMYVYYTPTHWAAASPAETEGQEGTRG